MFAIFALVLATSLAIARTPTDKNAVPPTGNQDTPPERQERSTPSDTHSGNDLAASKKDSTSARYSDSAKTDHVMSQDSKTGTICSAMPASTGFHKLDARKAGISSKSDAKVHPWL
jgi:hypothetical protein